MDNAAVQYTFYRRSDDGTDYRTDYQLLNKEAIKVNFSGKVTSAINMYPVNVDDTMLRQFAKYGFFSPEFVNDLLKNYHPSQNQPEAVTNIIADEFLRELAARRSTPEFQNIVFSIQKMQGEQVRRRQLPFICNCLFQTGYLPIDPEGILGKKSWPFF